MVDSGSAPPRNIESIVMVDIAAAGVNLIAQQSANFNTASITTQPARPRACRIVTASWDGGNVQVDGIDVGGDPASEVIVVGATGTYEGKIPWIAVTNLKNLGTRTAGTCDVRTGLGLGLPCRRGKMLALVRTSVNNAYEANGTVDIANSTVQPTTAPNGTNDYEFWVSVNSESSD